MATRVNIMLDDDSSRVIEEAAAARYSQPRGQRRDPGVGGYFREAWTPQPGWMHCARPCLRSGLPGSFDGYGKGESSDWRDRNA